MRLEEALTDEKAEEEERGGTNKEEREKAEEAQQGGEAGAEKGAKGKIVGVFHGPQKRVEEAGRSALQQVVAAGGISWWADLVRSVCVQEAHPTECHSVSVWCECAVSAEAIEGERDVQARCREAPGAPLSFFVVAQTRRAPFRAEGAEKEWKCGQAPE